MKKILLVKMSSMGDLIQAFPALTDATLAKPGLRFDWLVDEAFQDIPRLHRSVDKIITVPLRRLKKNWNEIFSTNLLKETWSTLRAQHYDMVIDAQSNLKSALLGLCTKGPRYGLDAKSVRERGAQWFYHHRASVSRDQNHALRIRQLMAAHLGYSLQERPIDYGINRDILPTLNFNLPEKFVFITAISSSNARLWPEAYWKTVFDGLLAQGYSLVVPWWSREEKERAMRLKDGHPHVHMLPSLNLLEKARVLSLAKAAVSLDTGLSHMAAALDVPNISLYGPTNPAWTGAYGKQQIHLFSRELSCSPCLQNVCTFSGASKFKPACLERVQPSTVLEALSQILPKGL